MYLAIFVSGILIGIMGTIIYIGYYLPDLPKETPIEKTFAELYVKSGFDLSTTEGLDAANRYLMEKENETCDCDRSVMHDCVCPQCRDQFLRFVYKINTNA